MTSGVHDAADATLLSAVRAGDTSAFGVLYERHHQAARQFARELVDSQPEADDVVTATFTRVRDVVRRGGGPADGFRPYLLLAVRRVYYNRLRRQRTKAPQVPEPAADPGEPALDPGDASQALILRAFWSLPERFRAVLWHADIEQSLPDVVAPLFGLSRTGVAALRRRALGGLREAYLELHFAQILWQDCRPVAQRLGAYLRDGLSKRDAALVAAHLDGCADCSATCATLADAGAALRAEVAPAILGAAAAAYLSWIAHAAASHPGGGTPAGAAAAGAPAASGRSGEQSAGSAAQRHSWHSPAGLLAGVSHRLRGVLARFPGLPDLLRGQRRLPAATGLGLAVLAIAAVAITLTAGGTPSHRGAGSPAAAGGRSPGLGAPQGAGSSARARPSATTRANRLAAHHRTRRPRPAVSPSATATASPVLAATVDVYGAGHHGSLAQITFAVTDTGAAATGELTATLTLPAGGSLATGHGPTAGGGWTCSQTASGATCQRGPIGAGQRVPETVYFFVPGSACGQHVQLSVAGGSAGTTAQSPETIQCQGNQQ